MLITELRRRPALWWLMHDLSVRHTARADGHKTPPRPSNAEPSQTELVVERRYDDRRAQLERLREGALGQHRVAAIQAGLGESERLIAAVVTTTKDHVRNHRLEPFQPQWTDAKTHIIATRCELDEFKGDHDIDRDAHDPEPMFAIGTLALAFVCESALNAALFSKVTEGAFVEGAILAGTLSLPNIGLGLITGFVGLRACHDMRPAVRRFGSVVTGVCVPMALAWNLYVGQLRALAETRAALNQPLSAADARAAAANVIADPLAPFQSSPSLTLVIVGVTVFAISLAHGLDGFSDRIPGFSRLSRPHKRAVAHARAVKAQFFARLDRFTDAGIREIERLHRGVHANLDAATRVLGRAARIIIRYNRRLADQLWVHREALSRYHAINRRARSERDVPDRFNRQPLPLAEANLPAFDWLAMHERLKQLADRACGRAQADMDELRRYREQIKIELNAELDALVTGAPVRVSTALIPAPEYA